MKNPVIDKYISKIPEIKLNNSNGRSDYQNKIAGNVGKNALVIIDNPEIKLYMLTRIYVNSNLMVVRSVR